MTTLQAIQETLYRYYHTENTPEARKHDFGSTSSGNFLSEYNALRLTSSITHYGGYLENPPSKFDQVWICLLKEKEAVLKSPASWSLLPTEVWWNYQNQRSRSYGQRRSLGAFLKAHSLDINDVESLKLRDEVFERV